MQWVRRLVWVLPLAALPVSVAADDIASCKKRAARDYAVNVQSCEKNLRGLVVRLRQCRSDAKARYTRAIAVCDFKAKPVKEKDVDDFPSAPPILR